MKIGVVSDTHIPGQAKEVPKIICEPFKKMDMIIHAGDLIVLSVLDSLKSICRNVKAVWGNMDPLEIRERIPEKQIITVNKYRIGLTHGRGSPVHLIEMVTDMFRDDKVDIIVFGHSHSPVNEKREGILYFNPGSLTDKFFSPFNSYGIIEINDEIKANIVKI